MKRFIINALAVLAVLAWVSGAYAAGDIVIQSGNSQTGGAGGAGGAIDSPGGRGGDAIVNNGGTGGAGGAGAPSGGHGVVQDRIPGLAVAPGLAAAGTGVCLGSFSVGLSGPMAGVAFGKTTVDKGCERRSNSVILYQRGFFEAADYLLRLDPEVQDAMDYQNKSGKFGPKVSNTEIRGVPQQVLSSAVVEECQGTDLKVTAANGQTFCRAR